MFYNFSVCDADSLRLDEFLREKLPQKTKRECSNSKIRRLIVSGCVKVNKKIVCRPAFELRGNSEVCVWFEEEKFFFEKQPEDVQFELSETSILYEDEKLIFVNKPCQFPVEQTITKNRENLHDKLVDFLWQREPSLRNPPYIGIMHRLDRTTSGVIVFTKTRAVNAAMSEVFQTHKLVKQYLAVVEDKKARRNDSTVPVMGEKFSVEMFMGRITGKSQQGKWGELSESRGGQYSKTDFKVLQHLNVEGHACLLIECFLHTGRTHQIRVHLASRGLPVLGDTLYGGKNAQRLYLHSARLAFELEGKHYDVKADFSIS